MLRSQSADTTQQPKDYSLTSRQKAQLIFKNLTGKKPRIVVIYDEAGGVAACSQAITHFEANGMQVVKVTPTEGLNHPIFKTQSEIAGIYLPGGTNIPVGKDDTDDRLRLEHTLLALAKENDIPVIGICRGHQVIGYHYGAKIVDLQEETDESSPGPIEVHYDDHAETTERDLETEIKGQARNPRLSGTVVVPEGSRFYNALNFDSSGENKEKTFEVVCAHYQHMTDIPKSINVVAYKKSDNVAEAIVVSTGQYDTMGLQHHPELVIRMGDDIRTKELNTIYGNYPTMSHYLDPELSQYYEFKIALESQAVRKPIIGENAANAEMGIFLEQVNHKFANSSRFVKHQADSAEQKQENVQDKKPATSVVQAPSYPRLKGLTFAEIYKQSLLCGSAQVCSHRRSSTADIFTQVVASASSFMISRSVVERMTSTQVSHDSPARSSMSSGIFTQVAASTRSLTMTHTLAKAISHDSQGKSSTKGVFAPTPTTTTCAAPSSKTETEMERFNAV